MDSRRFDPFYRPSVSKNIGGGGGRGDNQQLYDPESPRDSPSPDSFRSSDGRNRNSGYSRLSSGYGPQSYRDESAYSRPYPSNTSHSTMRRSPSPPRGTRYPPAPTLSSSPPSSRGGDYPPPPSARQQQHYHHQQATPTPPPPPLASHQHQSFDPFEDFGDMDSPGSRSRSASWSPRERSETAPGGETSVVPSPPPPPSFSEDSQKDKDPNPLSMLLENKNVSLSSLLEAALEPTGNKTVVEDPALKKKVLLSCQTTIAMLYRSRVSGIGSFVPQPIKPVVVIVDDCNDNNPLLLQHPRLEFNALPGDSSWKCPSVSVEVDKLMKSSRVDDDDDDDVTDQGKEVGMPISTVVNVKGMVTAPPPVVTRPVEYTSHMNTSQPFYALPPVYYPPRQVYPQMPFPQQQRPLTAGVTPQFQEREKSSSEKERKEKKKKKKRAKSRSRSRGRHGSRGRNRSRSRRRGRSRSRGKSRGRRGSRGNSRGSRGRSRGRRSRSVSKGRKQQQPQTNVAPHETPPAWLPQQFNQNFPPQPRPNFPPPFQQQQFWRPPPMNAPPQHFMPHHHNQPSNWMTPLPQPVAPPVGAWTQPPIAPVPPPNPVPPPRPILPPSPMPPRVNYPAPVPRPPLVTPQPAAFPSAMYMARKERVLLPIPVMFTSPPPPIPGTSPPVVDLTEPRSGREDKDSRRIDEDSRSRDRDERQEDGDDRRRDRRRERDRDGQNRRGRDRSRSNERHRYRERDGERDREKDKDRQRDRDRDRDRDRIKDSDRRDRDKDQRKKDRKNDDRRRDSSTERKKSKPGQDKTKSSDKEEKRSSKDRKTDEPGRKENETNREKENETNRGKENETNRGKENETNRGMENASNRSETVTTVDPPEYPSTNAEAKEADEGENEPKETDPERHAMNKKLGESLEKISKLIDGIFRIQRDSWELRELIKGLENRQQQNDGIYTLRNRLLCRVCIKSKDKFLKVVIPAASSRQFLKDLHRTYHDMSMNDMVDLLTDTFHEIPGPKTKLGLIMKECPTCKSQPTAPKADGGRFRAAEKRKLDHDGGVENDDGGGGGVGDESKNPPAAPENESSTVGGQPSTKRNRRKQTRKKKKQQLKSTNQTQKTEGPPPLQQPTAEPFRSPAVEPDATSSAAGSAPPHEAKRDFKSLVRQVQTNKVEFKIIINRLESNNRDDLDPSFVMKGGMLCKKCFIDGKSEIRIIIKNEQLDEMIKIVHELGPCHASVQKTMEVFNKHFSPIENLDEIVANFVSNCPVCKRK